MLLKHYPACIFNAGKFEMNTNTILLIIFIVSITIGTNKKATVIFYDSHITEKLEQFIF